MKQFEDSHFAQKCVQTVQTKIDRLRYTTALQSYTALLDLQTVLRKGCKSRDVKKQTIVLYTFHHIKILRSVLRDTFENDLEGHLEDTLKSIFGLLSDCDDGRFD